ncbi:MAG: hypothetical protein KAS12_03905 [Candidatus Aenigmarchaeota archaeon]|nr:hypothetical protein [Candidatus Aenigmarchaeota archaeon]
MVQKAKEEFIEHMTECSKIHGLDDITSRIMAILYIEPKELSLEEISIKTKYSLSAISTAMKFMERMEMVKRIKKPHSKKAYFYMEKDTLKMFLDFLKKQQEKITRPTIKKLPTIINTYENDTKTESKEELKIIKDYQKQIIAYEKIIEKTINLVEKEQNS